MVDLPEPDSPASPKRSPGRREKLTSIDRMHRAARVVVGHIQLFDAENLGGSLHRPPQTRIGDLVQSHGQEEQAEEHHARSPPAAPSTTTTSH